MTVHDEIMALCEQLARQDIKVTSKVIIERRGGSKRDVSRAVREFHAQQQRRNSGQPVLPAMIGRLDPDTITNFAQRLRETENLYIFGPPDMQRSIEKILSEILPETPDNFLKPHFVRENGSNMERLTQKSAIIGLLKSSISLIADFEKIFTVAIELDLPVQLIQAVPSVISDLPQGLRLHSLGLDSEKHGKITRAFLMSAALAEIVIAAKQLRDST